MGFELPVPASDRPQTHAWDGAATGSSTLFRESIKFTRYLEQCIVLVSSLHDTAVIAACDGDVRLSPFAIPLRYSIPYTNSFEHQTNDTQQAVQASR